MLKSITLPIALGVALVLGIPASTAAQQPAGYIAGGGLNLTTDPGITGQHIFAARLLPTPVSSLRGRFEGFVQTTEYYGTSLHATANLHLALLGRRSLRPYLLGGGGLHLCSSVGFAANAGLGVELDAGGRRVFSELVLRLFGTGDWQDGTFALSLGTAF